METAQGCAVPQRILERDEVGDKKKMGPTAPLVPAPGMAWLFLGLTGVVFFLIGSANQLLAVFPMRFGNAEWEFGTASAYLDAMPLPTLGVTLFVAAGMALGKRWMLRTSAVVLVLMSMMVLALLLVFALDVPLALRAVTEPAIRFGLKKAIVKGIAQGLGYPVILVLFASMAWRHSRATAAGDSRV
jgi:hypothetical protein